MRLTLEKQLQNITLIIGLTILIKQIIPHMLTSMIKISIMFVLSK